MAGDGFSFASLGNHLQLGHDRHGFEVNREGPQKLGDVEVVVDEEGHADGGNEDEFNSEPGK